MKGMYHRQNTLWFVFDLFFIFILNVIYIDYK